MILEKYLIELREDRKMNRPELAAKAGVTASLVHYVENGKKIRFNTVRRICKTGLAVTDYEWAIVKLLWLQQVSGEDSFQPTMTRAKKSMELKEMSAIQEFWEKLQDRVSRNMSVIDREDLRNEILEIFGNPKLIPAL